MGSPAESGEVGGGRLKWAVLLLLLFQNSGTALLMPVALKHAGPGYDRRTGVIMQELLKGVMCFFMLAVRGDILEPVNSVGVALRTGVPALLYLATNTLQYENARRLDSATFTVMYQLKILSTAMLSVALLRKHLNRMQWVALVMLVVGASLLASSKVDLAEDGKSHLPTDLVVGILGVLAACVCSSLAGVYFELLLKKSSVSLAARNVQMAFYQCAIAVVAFRSSGGSFGDFLAGYTPAIWAVVLNNAFGGLVVAAVIKYADNILKNFATALGIINTTMVSMLFLGADVAPIALLGICLVIAAVLTYGGVCVPARQAPAREVEMGGKGDAKKPIAGDSAA